MYTSSLVAGNEFQLQHFDHTTRQRVQDGDLTESLLRALLTVRPLAGSIAKFILETLVALTGSESDLTAACSDGAGDTDAPPLAHLLLHQLEALDLAGCSDDVLDTFLEAFEAAPLATQAPLASLIGEMVPRCKAKGALASPRLF